MSVPDNLTKNIVSGTIGYQITKLNVFVKILLNNNIISLVILMKEIKFLGCHEKNTASFISAVQR